MMDGVELGCNETLKKQVLEPIGVAFESSMSGTLSDSSVLTQSK